MFSLKRSFGASTETTTRQSHRDDSHATAMFHWETQSRRLTTSSALYARVGTIALPNIHANGWKPDAIVLHLGGVNKSLVCLLPEDIDWTYTPSPNQACLLYRTFDYLGHVKSALIFLRSELRQQQQPPPSQHDDAASHRVIRSMYKQMLLNLKWLLASFPSHYVCPLTGDNALHAYVTNICRNEDVVETAMVWALLRHNVSGHTRNRRGYTPLLRLFSACVPLEDERITGPIHALLQEGSDIHAQDPLGNTAMHYMIEQRQESLLRNLYREHLLDAVDYTLANDAGVTVLEHAQRVGEDFNHLGVEPYDDPIFALIREHQHFWLTVVKPTMQAMLEEKTLPVLAKIVLLYVSC